MKHSHLLKIRSAAATLCAAILLCACSNEIGTGGDKDGGKEGEPTTVTMSVGTASGEQTILSKALSPDQENAIQTIYILAFQPDATDGTYKLKYYATGQPVIGGNGKFTFTLRRSVSGVADTKLLLIANQNPYPLVNIGMTYEGVQTVLTSVELGTAPAFADTGIPMFGFAGNSPDTPLEIIGGMQLGANLLRAVARVDVGVGTYNSTSGVWNKGGVDFDLKEIYVFRPQNKFTLLPLISNLEYIAGGGTPSVTAPSPAGTSATRFEYQGTAITNDTYCKAEIYIPEVDFNGGKVYDANHESRTALVIGGLYNGRANYYRIDFTTAPTNLEGTPLRDVLRNRIYRYSITSVSQPGYTTPEAAYGGQAVGLGFTVGIIDWGEGRTVSPDPDMLVRMNYRGINGTITTGTTSGTSVVITPKIESFTTDDGKVKPVLEYNNLVREAADNTYNGTGNGGIYRNIEDAFKREGPYGKLIIAPDNTDGTVAWKTGTTTADRVLVAKKACWDYRGQGQNDWRLPRLSELYLLWLNKETINQSKGFTSLGEIGDPEEEVTYWSGTEGKASNGDTQVYTVNAAGAISLHPKTSRFSVRCVREVR